MYIYIFYIYIYIPIFYFKLKLKRCPHPGSDELLTSNIFLNSRFSNTLFLCFLCCHVFMFLCLMLFYSFGLIYHPNLKYRRWLEPPHVPNGDIQNGFGRPFLPIVLSIFYLQLIKVFFSKLTEDCQVDQ